MRLGLDEYSGQKHATTLMESTAVHLPFQGFFSIVQKRGVAAGQRSRTPHGFSVRKKSLSDVQ
jgi:hypothetical protein